MTKGPVSSGASRASELTTVLSAEILAGKLPAGAPLRQSSLAARFGVSRTPIREALHRLVANGLADFQSHSGFRVRSVAPSEFLDVLLIRSRLEGLAAERAVPRITCGQLDELADIATTLETVGQRLTNADPASEQYLLDQTVWSRENTRFHNLLLSVADCPPLEHATAMAVQTHPREVTWLAAQRYPRLLGQYAEDHRRICEALRRGDARAARRSAQVHVERALDHMRRVFTERGPLTEDLLRVAQPSELAGVHT